MFKLIDEWKDNVNVYVSMSQILLYAPFEDRRFFHDEYLIKGKKIPFPVKGIYSNWDRVKKGLRFLCSGEFFIFVFVFWLIVKVLLA